jgi:hypothetical protein
MLIFTAKRSRFYGQIYLKMHLKLYSKALNDVFNSLSQHIFNYLNIVLDFLSHLILAQYYVTIIERKSSFLIKHLVINKFVKTNVFLKNWFSF